MDWAETQMSLDNAFLVLGERESGTERLDQAVAAYRAALDPDQAFTWPNQASSRTATPPRAPLALGRPRLSGREPALQNLVLGSWFERRHAAT